MRHEHVERAVTTCDRRREFVVASGRDRTMLIGGERDAADVSEMIAVALRANEIACAALQPGKERIVPHGFVEHGGRNLLSAWTSAGAEMSRGLELIHELGDRMVVGEKRREHGAADIGRMRTG
jgi:hypothetical protein